MNPFAKSLKADTRQAVLAPDGRVYLIQRINASALADHRWIELLAAQDAARALGGLQASQAQAAALKKLERLPEAKRAEAKEKIAAQDAHNQQLAAEKILEAMTRSPETLARHAARVEAYVCAGVIGGLVLDEGHGFEVGVLPQVPDEIVPIRFTREESQEDLASDPVVLWVGNLDETTRGWLCGMISALSQSPVEPFRGRAGDGGHAGSHGSPVRLQAVAAAKG